MSIRRSLLTGLALLASTMVTGAWAADPAPTAAPAPDMKAMMHHGAHGKRCAMHEKMMGRGHHASQMIMIPRLPRGNEKLQLQMHAEILQKVGEIEAKYAAQLP